MRQDWFVLQFAILARWFASRWLNARDDIADISFFVARSALMADAAPLVDIPVLPPHAIGNTSGWLLLSVVSTIFGVLIRPKKEASDE